MCCSTTFSSLSLVTHTTGMTHLKVLHFIDKITLKYSLWILNSIWLFPATELPPVHNTSRSVSVCTPIVPFELISAHVCCTGLKHLTRQWALYRCCRISYCCENLCWSLSIQEHCECVFSYEARTAALISTPFITHYKHSRAQYNRGSPFHKKCVLTLQCQHFAKLMVKGCIRKVSDSNPGPPRGFNGGRVFPAEECLDGICKNTVTNRFHSPAVYNSVSDSSTARLHSSHCEGFVLLLSTIWLNPFDFKASGYYEYMHRYI